MTDGVHMRYFISHRLPGGFRAGVSVGGGRGRRYRRARSRVRVRTTYVRSQPALVVHMNGAQYAAHQKRQQEASARGCAVIAGVLALGLAIEFWYVALPALFVIGASVLAVRHRRAGSATGAGSDGKP